MSLTGALTRAPLAPALWGLDGGWSGTAADRATRYGLVAAWNIDESSGSRADSFGANILTDVNTVTGATGPDGAGASQFTAANSESLSSADNAALSVGDVDAWWSGWPRFDTLTPGGGFRELLGKNDGGSNQREYDIAHAGTLNRFFFQVSSSGLGGGAQHAAVADAFGNAATNTWYHVFCYHNAATDVIGIAVNGGTINTLAHSGGIFDGTATFRIGAAGNTATLFWDGPQAMWKMGKLPAGTLTPALLAEIKTYEYNGGLGRRYPAGWT